MDAEALQRGDVGARGDLVRSVLVVEAVAGEEGDGDWFAAGEGWVIGGRCVAENGDGGGGKAPWRRSWWDSSNGSEGRTREGAEAGATYDCYCDWICGVIDQLL